MAREFFDHKGKFLHSEFAEWLLKEREIVLIDNVLAIRINGVYERGDKAIERAMLEKVSDLKRADRSEVLSYLELYAKNERLSSCSFIAFENGVYCTDTGVFKEDFKDNLVITNRIPHKFNMFAYSEIADRTLNKLSCNDSEIRALLEEVIGYTFFRRNELRKAFIFTGEKANGKSTFIDMIATLLGDENTSALDLRELSDRFKTAELYGKLANLGDDIEGDYISNPAILKKAVSGDRINAERKGKDPFDFKPYAKLIFSANDIPKIKDRSGAVLDRLIIVPFNATFSKSDPDFDPFIASKLREEEVMEYLIQIGIKGLHRVLANNSFTLSKKVKESLCEYSKDNNPIGLFAEEEDILNIVGYTAKEVYVRYVDFCKDCGYKTLALNEFSKRLQREMRLKTITKREGDTFTKVYIRDDRAM